MRKRDIREITSLKPGDQFYVVRQHVCGPCIHLDEPAYRFQRINNVGRIVAWPVECGGSGGQPAIFHESTRVYRLTKAEIKLTEKVR